MLVSHEKLVNNDKAKVECINEQKEKLTGMTQTLVSIFLIYLPFCHNLHWVNDLFSLKETLETQNIELKNKISSLQHELDNAEAVQQDFVRLSQNLQVGLRYSFSMIIYSIAINFVLQIF